MDYSWNMLLFRSAELLASGIFFNFSYSQIPSSHKVTLCRALGWIVFPSPFSHVEAPRGLLNQARVRKVKGEQLKERSIFVACRLLIYLFRQKYTTMPMSLDPWLLQETILPGNHYPSQYNFSCMVVLAQFSNVSSLLNFSVFAVTILRKLTLQLAQPVAALQS